MPLGIERHESALAIRRALYESRLQRWKESLTIFEPRALPVGCYENDAFGLFL
jgi:hypothetical protein